MAGPCMRAKLSFDGKMNDRRQGRGGEKMM
jgi:hypothetical protein